jgi:hypothetical protein
MAVNGVALAAVAAGAVFVYASAKGKSVLASVQAVVAGKSPSTAAAANPITATVSTTAGAASSGAVTAAGGSPSGGSNTANAALGKLMAAAYGWATGAEWTALNNIVMSESGWNDEAANPSSNARGIAQNINGWSASYQAGNASQQIAWLLAYIKSRYGDPVAAWNFHLANGYY